MEGKTEDSGMLRLVDWQQAADVGSACNLSGVVHSFSKVMDRVWNEARATHHGTDWVNRHPIAILYSEAVAGLTGTGVDNMGPGCAAYVTIQLEIEKLKTAEVRAELSEK